jgi:hypothetical protein
MKKSVTGLDKEGKKFFSSFQYFYDISLPLFLLSLSPYLSPLSLSLSFSSLSLPIFLSSLPLSFSYLSLPSPSLFLFSTTTPSLSPSLFPSLFSLSLTL